MQRPTRLTTLPAATITIALMLAALACNAGANRPDVAATVQAVYLTITAQAATAGVPVTDTPVGSPSQATTTSTPIQTYTPTASPTPPDSRSSNGPDIAIVRCTGGITVDGDSADWAMLSDVWPFVLTTSTYGAEQWSGTSDLSGQARLCWTDNALYLFVEVTDDAHVQTQTGSNAWKGDEVELVFDGDLRGDFYEKRWNNDDTQLGLSPGDFSDLPPAAVRYFPSIQGMDDVQLAARRPIAVGGNYTLEAAIAWDVLGVMPQSEGHYGLCLALSDNDQVGQASQDTMVSHCTRLLVSDPTTWATVQLMP